MREAIDNALGALYRQPQTPGRKRDIEQYRASVGPAFAQVHDAVDRLHQVALQAKVEHDGVEAENARLKEQLRSVDDQIAGERRAKHAVLRWSTLLIVAPVAAMVVLWAIGL